jgi:tetratricopeptide (TPR) repeat protein
MSSLVQEHPAQLDFRTSAAIAWNSLASLANERGDAAAAIGFAERAIAQQEQVLAALPGDRRARWLLAIHQGHLAYGLAHAARWDEAIAAARQAIANAGRQTSVLRMAAHAATLAALAPAGADATPRAERRESHAQVAVEALARIADVNRREAARLLADDRFASLRDRPDFQALRGQVEAR